MIMGPCSGIRVRCRDLSLRASKFRPMRTFEGLVAGSGVGKPPLVGNSTSGGGLRSTSGRRIHRTMIMAALLWHTRARCRVSLRTSKFRPMRTFEGPVAGSGVGKPPLVGNSTSGGGLLRQKGAPRHDAKPSVVACLSRRQRRRCGSVGKVLVGSTRMATRGSVA